uniref:Uncharacterized protein n=1 Tax=Sphaerodactylus townsendi TaxID=933632 RepID=A0ACB8EZS1_9SAUR
MVNILVFETKPGLEWIMDEAEQTKKIPSGTCKTTFGVASCLARALPIPNELCVPHSCFVQVIAQFKQATVQVESPAGKSFSFTSGMLRSSLRELGGHKGGLPVKRDEPPLPFQTSPRPEQTYIYWQSDKKSNFPLTERN